MNLDQVGSFHEFLRRERTFRWDAACGRIPGREDGAAGMREKRKEAEALDSVIERLDELLGLDPRATFTATEPVRIPRALSAREVVELAELLRAGMRDHAYDSPAEYMFSTAYDRLMQLLGTDRKTFEETHPVPPRPPPCRLLTISIRGVVVYQAGEELTDEEREARFDEAFRRGEE